MTLIEELEQLVKEAKLHAKRNTIGVNYLLLQHTVVSTVKRAVLDMKKLKDKREE